MKLVIGIVVSFMVGAGCRYFDIPVPSPPIVPGALLVLAMTVGYSVTDKTLNRKGNFATTAHLCGGPNGIPKSSLAPVSHATITIGDRKEHGGV